MSNMMLSLGDMIGDDVIIADHWLLDKDLGLAVGYARCTSSNNGVILNDVQVRFKGQGLGRVLIRELEDFYMGELLVTGCWTSEGEAFIRALGLRQSPVHVPIFGDITDDGGKHCEPLTFVRNWERFEVVAPLPVST